MEKLVQREKKKKLLSDVLCRVSPKECALKILSLFLAIFLWYFVVGEDQVDITLTVPIEILNLPADLVISNHFKKDIEVSVRGPRSMIQELRRQNITRPIDLSTAKPGTLVIKNEADSIPFPMGITVLRLQPANTTLLIDKLVKKNLPIHPVIEGEPAPGYELGKITLRPDQLTISGPRHLLESQLALKTYVINLDGLDHSTTVQVQLNLSPELLNLIGETVVSVEISLKEKLLRKTVRGIPVNVRDATVPVVAVPGSVAVVADIPENLIRDTPELAMLFRASVSARDVRKSQKAPVNVVGVNVPGHAPIQVISVRPDQVSLRLVRQQKKEKPAPTTDRGS
jgi:hypothetical protein